MEQGKRNIMIDCLGCGPGEHSKSYWRGCESPRLLTFIFSDWRRLQNTLMHWITFGKCDLASLPHNEAKLHYLWLWISILHSPLNPCL